MISRKSKPVDYYVRLVYSNNFTRESMEIYRQKARDAEEFVCIEQDQLPAGQHMIEFLSATNRTLPGIVAEMKRSFGFVLDNTFDHHLVPVYIEKLFDLCLEVRKIHPWWAASLPLGQLWKNINDYSFYSIHPSPYLIETYDEVDRLLNEETCWRTVVDSLQSVISRLDAYIHCLKSFEDALTLCLDKSTLEPLSGLSTLQRAFVFQSFFDDLLLNSSNVKLTLHLQETGSSPLGTTVTRTHLHGSDESYLQATENKNMDFNSIFYGSQAIGEIRALVSMVEGKKVEMGVSIILQSPDDIYMVCSYSFFRLLCSNVRIKRCRNCGEYFVPLNRSDEQYCCRMQKNGKRCRDLDYSDKIDTDKLLSIYRTAYKTHNARKQRTKKNNINAEEKFKSWIVFAKQLLEHAKAGELSIEEYSELIRK